MFSGARRQSPRWARRSIVRPRAVAGDRQREREGRPRPFRRLDPDAPAVLLRRCAARSPGRAPCRPARLGPALGRPCRTARRSALWAPAGCPRPWSATEVTTPRPRARARRTISPPLGLNLTALWSRLTSTWPRRASSPRMLGRSSGTSTRSVTPWRSANSRRRSVDCGREPARGRRRRQRELDVTALDPRQVEQLVDHLDEVARLDVDLADPVAHLGGTRRRRAPPRGQGLGQQAHRRERRPQLVRQVVDELRPDPLEPAQLGDVIEHEPEAATMGSAGADSEGRPVGIDATDLAAGRAVRERRLCHRLHRRIEERLHDRSTHERPRRPAQERVGGRVCRDDTKAAIHAHDPGAQRPQQGGLLLGCLCDLIITLLHVGHEGAGSRHCCTGQGARVADGDPRDDDRDDGHAPGW